MIPKLLRFGTGVAFLMILLSPMTAQEKQPPMEKAPPGGDAAAKDLEDYRQFFKKPETVEEYWKAMQFEIDVGQYGIAAQMLRGLIAKQPTDDELVQLETKYGMAAFLKLRTLPPFLDRDQKRPRWSENPKVQQQALDDIEQLINLVTAAVKKKLADRERIVKYVQALTADPEEAAFALKQLYPYRALAVPPLIDELRAARTDEDRLALRNALRKLPPDVIPPLVAALDSDDANLILDVLTVFVQRGAKETVPYLWYLSVSPAHPETVRAKATAALVFFLDVPASKLPPAKLALTREAERYYQHQVAFPDPKAVVIWRWEKKGIVQGWPGAETVPATKAEEYYGLHFARQALALDPAYQPAQETLLSIALEKTLETADLSLPLAKISPSVHELLTASGVDVLLAVLERALTEQRSTVVLACVRALGERVEARASKPTGRGEPALVRALDYGSERVQMAAAESLLRMPTSPSSIAKQRIVEILNRNLAVVNRVSLESKVIVASSETEARQRMAQAVTVSGFEPIALSSGREVLRRLNAASDISAIIVESTLPDPGLASFIAQLRADVNASRLPLLVLAVPDNAESRELVKKYAADRARLDVLISRTRAYRVLRQDLQVKYEQSVANINKSGITGQSANRDYQIAVQTAQHRDELQVLANKYPDGTVMDKEAQDIEKRLKALEARYSAQCQRREEALKRWLEGYQTVAVAPLGSLEDPKKLRYRLFGEEGKTETKPLTEAEHKEYAEKAIQYFARMARGEIDGYYLQPFADTIYNALRGAKLSEKGQADAIDVVVHLSALRSQTELTDVVLDEKRPLGLRVKATDALITHIQQNSLLLVGDALARLRKLYEESAQVPEWKDFRAKLAVLQGSLRPDTRSTGERLRDYQPAVPAAPAAPPGGNP
jgi:CheY-like chemotaxis protein